MTVAPSPQDNLATVEAAVAAAHAVTFEAQAVRAQVQQQDIQQQAAGEQQAQTEMAIQSESATKDLSNHAETKLAGEVGMKVVGEATGLSGVLEMGGAVRDVLNDRNSPLNGMDTAGMKTMKGPDVFASMKAMNKSSTLFAGAPLGATLGEKFGVVSASIGAGAAPIKGVQVDAVGASQMGTEVSLALSKKYVAENVVAAGYGLKQNAAARQAAGLIPGMGGARAPRLALDDYQPKGPSKELLEEA